MGGTRRRRVEPTDECEQLKLLCRWPEQLAYEEIRPTVLFGSSVRDRAQETGSSERTLYRKAARFDREGIDSLFDSAGAKRRELPPVVRRMIVELKAEYPGFSLGEMATICYVRIGRRPGKHTIERVLSEEPVPPRMLRRFERYHGIPEPKERKRAVVARSPDEVSMSRASGVSPFVPRAAVGPVDLDRHPLRGGPRFHQVERHVRAGVGE